MNDKDILYGHDMSISALEEKNAKKIVISKKKTEEILQNIREKIFSVEIAEFYTESAVLYDDVEEIISSFVKESVENMERSEAYYGGGWIPCKDKLPKEEGYYLVTYMLDDTGELVVHELYYGDEEDSGEFKWHPNDDYGRFFIPITFIAWRLLPQPYFGE